MEVLLAGNTGYVTETFIEESFPECDVVVLGNEMLKSNRKKNILSRPFIKDDHAWKDDRRTGTTETDTSVMQKE